jgi:hypothetical protein
MVQKSQGPDFASWLNTLSIGSLEIRRRPQTAGLVSRIRKMAVAAETADTIKASVAVALCGAISLKLRKMTTSQNDLTAANSARRIVYVPFANRPVLNIHWLRETELQSCTVWSQKRTN